MDSTAGTHVLPAWPGTEPAPVGPPLANEPFSTAPLRIPPHLAVHELLSRLDSCRDVREACQTLADGLLHVLGVRSVALAIARRNRTCSLQGLSGQPRFDAQGELPRLLETACDDAVLCGGTIVDPAWQARSTTPIQEKLRVQLEAGGLWTSPLYDADGALVGAWVTLADQPFTPESHRTQLLTGVAPLLGARLAVLRRAEPTWLDRGWNRLRATRRSWQGKAISAGIALAVLILLIPLPYRVSSDCILQPVVRRFVAAPFGGRLERAHVAPGDIVSPGDVLATLDGREIRLELAGIEAEQNQATKRRDAALAAGKVADAQLARLERERLDLKRQLLEDRFGHLDIKSPIAGVVVSGDQQKAEGVALDTGQTLFEIAPLDQMVVEVAIPEADVAYVEQGMNVGLRLDAFPRRSWAATIDKLHPRSEQRDRSNVFIAELRLPNSDGQLRPGMKGRAKVAGPSRPLWWNLFHKAWEALALRLGW